MERRPDKGRYGTLWFCHICRWVGWMPTGQPHICEPNAR